MPNESEQERLFITVLVEGTETVTDAWIALGPKGLDRLRRELSGEVRADIPGDVHPKVVIDNLTWASRKIGTAYPEEFLSTFPSPQWDSNPFVCAGLGGIQLPDATRRLMRLLSHDDKWIRIQAAAALRGHRHRGLESALLAARDDPEFLVRYQVEERIAELAGIRSEGTGG